MSLRSDNLQILVIRRVKAEGLDWDNLVQSAKQIIVFGSYALSVNKRGSDLDILCIGNGKRYKSKKLHIVWVPEKNLHAKQWLSSELATHVSAYGKWIKGNNDWAHQTKPGRFTIIRKKKNILDRLKAAQRHWDDLLPKFRVGQLTKLRRDMQRYQMMRCGQAPVPKALLDSEWHSHKVADRWKTLLNNRSGIAKQVERFLVDQKIWI